MNKIITIYTDGSCLKNNNGGWGCYIIENNKPDTIISGGEIETTNNRMELTAVIESLLFFSFNRNNDRNTIYKIYSDSKLVINCASNLWKRNMNLDLWKKYDSVSFGKKIQWFWVKGHSGDKYNEIVDKVARKESESLCK